MTIAGESAGLHARRQRALAERHDQAAAEARAEANRYEIAHVTEAATARLLGNLRGTGWHLLADRRWPGGRNAQVDLVLVGPGGVFIIDTKAWAEVSIERGRMYRGQEDVTDDIARIADIAWNAQNALAEIGLPAGEVHAVVALAGKRGINERVGPVQVVGDHDLVGLVTRPGRRLGPVQLDAVLAATMQHFPPLSAQDSIPLDVSIRTPPLPREPDTAIPMAITPGFESQSGDQDLGDLLTDGPLAAPIEDWMTFLDPAQAKLIRRSFNGPSRIRGAAGTGKTVVGLHRAAYLARSNGGRVLFTTFIGTLPGVLENLFSRLAPDVADRVDFISTHKFAIGLLRERGHRVRVDDGEGRSAFLQAWNRVSMNSPLRLARFTRPYWEDEVKYVIKGRGLTSFDEYAELARVGRRFPLTLDHRKAVWDLYCDYEEQLRERSLDDWEDVVLRARESARAIPVDQYDAVIVDEAQDLTAAMVSLLHTIVGDRPDGLTLLGDGQQTIYPGGYTLAEIGVSLAGRGSVLSVNHRNTAEILTFAKSVVTGDRFEDIEGIDGAGDVVTAVARSGPQPITRTFPTWKEHDRALVEHVRQVSQLVGTGLGDVAVLCATKNDVRSSLEALHLAGIPCVALTDYVGSTSDAVKVGTIKRSKGLEFKQVLLARVRPSLLSENETSAPTVDATESAREKRELERRELYVGMTRARDGLWLGSKEPMASC